MKYTVTTQTRSTEIKRVVVEAKNEKEAIRKADGLVVGVEKAKLLTPEYAKNWKVFVADFVVMMTARKENRELVRNYQVRRKGGMYKIYFGGRDGGYGFMTAEDLYSWMERLPLVYFSRQADEIRYTLLS